MNRFRTLIAAGTLITLSAVAGGCTSTGYSYRGDTSFNPACDDGFRPGNNRPCTY